MTAENMNVAECNKE